MNPLEALKEKLKYKPVVGDKKPVAVVIGKPEIVDETDIAFPRKDLLAKFEKSGITKVTMKPVLKVQQEEEIFKPTKAKKIGKKKLKIVEDIPAPNIEGVAFEKSEQNFVPPQPLEKVGPNPLLRGPMGSLGNPRENEVVLEPDLQEDAPIRKIRKKITKGVAVIGPETIVEFGDISKR